MNVLIAAMLAVALPPDQTDKLVEAQLQPRWEGNALTFPHVPGPQQYTRPTFLLPELPLSKFTGGAPRAQFTTPAVVVRPAPLIAELPLSGLRAEPVRPEEMQLAAGALIRLPALDVETPIALPTLARPKAERAALADPTVAASLQAALAQPIPVRINPDPFVPVNLPRPFEHRETVRLRQSPPEDSTPIVGSPQRP